MFPRETLFLESTKKICREDVSNSFFVNFQIWDFPGQIDFFDPTFDYEMIFRGTGALIFVIDSQVRRHFSVWWDRNAPPPLHWHKFLCDHLGLGFRIRNRHFCQTSISQLWLSGFGKGEKNLPSRNPEQQAVFGNCVRSASLKRTSQREGTTVIANESSCVSPPLVLLAGISKRSQVLCNKNTWLSTFQSVYCFLWRSGSLSVGIFLLNQTIAVPTSTPLRQHD